MSYPASIDADGRPEPASPTRRRGHPTQFEGISQVHAEPAAARALAAVLSVGALPRLFAPSAATGALQAVPCQEAIDADLWFAERTADVERAKAMCRPCPIRYACLAGALDRGEPWGVWGGEVFVDGAVVETKRGRGRPRKAGPTPFGPPKAQAGQPAA